MTITPDRDVGCRPVGADMSHEAPDVTGGFLARGRLAGAQQHRHRPAGGSVVDVDRQEAAFAVVAIPKGELLVAVDHVAGVVDVERHRLGFGRIAVAVDGNHRAHQPCQLPCGRGVLPPAHRRLTGETWSRPRQLAQRQAGRRQRPKGGNPGSSRRASRSSASS